MTIQTTDKVEKSSDNIVPVTSSRGISCVIPTFNRKDKVVHSIESLLDQKFDLPYEIIVVDDGSEDGTVEQLEHYYADNPIVRIISKKNGGVSSARNEGIKHAIWDNVAFLDSDDWSLGNRLKVLHDKMVKENASFVHAKALFVDEKGELADDGMYYYKGHSTPNGHWGKIWSNLESGASTREQILSNEFSPVHAQTVLVKKSLLDELKARDGNYFDEHLDYVEDFDLWRRIANTIDDKKMVFASEEVSVYTIGSGNSFSNQKRNELGSAALKNKEAARQRFGKNPGVLFLAGYVTGCHKKILREYCEGLFENGITKVTVLEQPRWFGHGKEYESKKITNSMCNDAYLSDDSYFEETDDYHESLEEMLEAVDAKSYDIIHIVDNRWADEIVHLKKLNKKIVYKLCSLIQHEVTNDPDAYRFVEPIKNDINGESVLKKQERILEAADVIHVETAEYAEIVASYYPQLKDKLVVVKNSPDFSDDEVNEIVHARENYQCIENNRFLSVGRLDRVKGYEQTLRAFAKVVERDPTAHLDICGDSDNDDYKEKLFKLTHELNLKKNVFFHGNQSKTALKEFYKRARIYVQPSLHEQCATTMLNAGRVGITVIGSDIPDVAGLFSEDYKTGLMAKRRAEHCYYSADVDDLAGKMLYALDNQFEAYVIGQNAKKSLESKGYTRKAVLENVLADYESLLKN